MYIVKSGETVLNVDKLTYAVNLHHLSSIGSVWHIFVEGDIGN